MIKLHLPAAMGRTTGWGRTLGRAVLEFIYPPYCILCGARLRADHRLVCTGCWRLFRDRPAGVPLTRQDLRLSGRTHFDSIYAVYTFDKRAMSLIHEFKYNGYPVLAGRMGADLGDVIGRLGPYAGADLMLPVPLHPTRRRERGFNQSALLVAEAAKRCGLPWNETALRRQVNNPSQTGLSYEQRAKNVRGIFEVLHPEQVRGKAVVLVDDVVTTGLTVNEVSRTLRQAGAASVRCLTMVHPPLSGP